MIDMPNEEETDVFSNSIIINNYKFLQDSGLLSYFETLKGQISSYKKIVAGAIDLFNGTSVDEIISSAQRILFDQFLPDYVYFFLKPIRKDPAPYICCYKDYKRLEHDPIDFSFLKTLNDFEEVFQRRSFPIDFGRIDEKHTLFEPASPFRPLEPSLLVPVAGKAVFYGIILMGGKLFSKFYTPLEKTFIRNFSTFIAQALQSNFNYEGSLRDTKTGLFNHRYFLLRLNEEMERIKRGSESSSVIMLDIDFFKRFNDNYGHLAGDYVLERIAEVLRQSIRRQDVPARFGGEEFIILLPGADRCMAWTAAERLRVAVAEMKTDWEMPLPHITVSLGVFTIDGRADISANDSIARTDKALYQSKDRGRNCTSAYGSGLLNKANQIAYSDSGR
jgi:diguanylate cyclase (GGDEF)-like protein